MTKSKNEEYEKEYNELRLRYAFENPEIKELFSDCLKNEENYRQQSKEREENPTSTATEYLHDLGFKRFRAWDTLIMRMNRLGLPHVSSQDIVDDYCRIILKKQLDISIVPKRLPNVMIKQKYRRAVIDPEEDSFFKLKEIFKKGSFEENEQWFVENYHNFKFAEEKEHFSPSSQVSPDWRQFSRDKSIIFNRGTKKFYRFKKSGKYNFLIEIDLIDYGQYLGLYLDLTKKIEDIEKDLKEAIKYFKGIMDNISPDAKTKTRRQDIDLYKRYLWVYQLVQEKGEKWTEIAKEIFPEDFKSEDELSESDPVPNPESALAKVHNYYKEAKKLIAEGLP